MNVEAIVVSGQTGALLAVGVLLAYPVARYSTNVAHTKGLVLLSAGFFSLAASYGVGLAVGTPVAGLSLSLLSALFGTAGVARFALPFVRTDGADGFDAGSGRSRTDEPETSGSEGGESETRGSSGGFGDAKRE